MVNGKLNICPTIDGIGANPAEVEVGGAIALSAAAHDSDAGPSPLSFGWTATAGTLSDASARNPTFTCTTPGSVTVRLTVSDGDPAASCADTSVAQVPCSVAPRTPGTYVAGDFHNHTTCSDGAISMQKLVKKATDRVDTPWGLDWFVQAGHGGNGNRNCTLVEDATLSTPAYPFVAGLGPNTSWENSNVTPKGDVSGTSPNRNMWRWQSIQEFQYPLIEYLNALKNLPLFLGIETVVPGHEHTSMSIITGQIPTGLDAQPLPAGPPYTPLGNGNALAQWEYCFDRGDTDTSRGTSNQWDCSVPGSLNAADPSWNAAAQKLIPAGGAGNGTLGHQKTLEALKWMAAFHPDASYYVPAHLERAGQFNPDGNNGYNVEHLRDFNNTAPRIAFGFETQPGHGASSNRVEYQVKRNTIGGVPVRPGSRARLRGRAEEHRPARESSAGGAAHLQCRCGDRPADDGGRGLRRGAVTDPAARAGAGAHPRALRHRRSRRVLVLAAHRAAVIRSVTSVAAGAARGVRRRAVAAR